MVENEIRQSSVIGAFKPSHPSGSTLLFSRAIFFLRKHVRNLNMSGQELSMKSGKSSQVYLTITRTPQLEQWRTDGEKYEGTYS